MQKTFGPSGHMDKNGAIKLSCRTGSTYCFLLYGSNKCHEVKPPREIEDTKSTPDWCKYAAGMAEDMREMHDLDRMGLADLTRVELLPMMKSVAPEFLAIDSTTKKPFKLTEHSAGMMRRAIRLSILAKEGGAA
jgi:hypothetical protein